MKTTISLPDSIFDAAEAIAKQLGVSRSQLYTMAIIKFLESQDNTYITEILNAVYIKVNKTIDPHLLQIQFNSISEERW